MKQFFAGLGISALTAFAFATPLLAQAQRGVDASGGRAGGGRVVSVPEIDAATGLLALAAVAAALLFVWERRRRRG
ncbi:MAG: VPEID-CTERM sorting domain-containing protein [Pararhodobacter sp.]|nr:VPEID-CTERM sorting domain-containing protein [Pararhodobacter sp.]